VPVEVYPIFAVVGGAVTGAGFYLYRLSQGTEVVWNRHGDWRPWDVVKQDQNIKFSECPFFNMSNPSDGPPQVVGGAQGPGRRRRLCPGVDLCCLDVLLRP
jgi:hypothetical protein